MARQQWTLEQWRSEEGLGGLSDRQTVEVALECGMEVCSGRRVLSREAALAQVGGWSWMMRVQRPPMPASESGRLGGRPRRLSREVLALCADRIVASYEEVGASVPCEVQAVVECLRAGRVR